MFALTQRRPTRPGGRIRRGVRALPALLSVLPVLGIQCGDEARRVFRQTAWDGVSSGLQAIVNGQSAEVGGRQILNAIIEGVFQTEVRDTRYGTDGGTR